MCPWRFVNDDEARLRGLMRGSALPDGYAPEPILFAGFVILGANTWAPQGRHQPPGWGKAAGIAGWAGRVRGAPVTVPGVDNTGEVHICRSDQQS